ncbi:SSrecog-domain-containing protein [Gonapodya prolifera JEL478]|uniref:SSrecog-domain-containing protein n=1 Tax=Gonapodya prolifera (strain JEL478) TaxID=1344416 RepID=A0A139AD84_GONPJ|nr:SSrecog-domain-containing protein [Gonapodya prolifera JEL478]|eukprot:KXS14730.1 SSrecog-domain-containing protein [Gonapodya prolifera JEL478]
MELSYNDVALWTPKTPQNGVGQLKLIEAGIGFKNPDVGQPLTLKSDNVRAMTWLRGARGWSLKIALRSGTAFLFEGLPRTAESDLEKLSRAYGATFDVREYSLKGWNWGRHAFNGDTLTFNVGARAAFEIPLSQVSNTTHPTRNEVVLEFAPPEDGPGAGPDRKRRRRDDELVEMRFYIPSKTSNRSDADADSDADDQVDADGEDAAVGENGEKKVKVKAPKPITPGDEDDEALTDSDTENPAEVFFESVKEHADLGGAAGEAVLEFAGVNGQGLLCLSPRGRFTLSLHPTFFRLRGRTHDYRVDYTRVQHLFLLPKPDDGSYFFVVHVHPPLRQGNTPYRFLVFQFGEAEEVEVEMRDVEGGGVGDIPPPTSRLRPSYDGETFKIVSEVLSVVTRKKVITDAHTAAERLNVRKREEDGNGDKMELDGEGDGEGKEGRYVYGGEVEVSSFETKRGKPGLKCNLKANEAYLYPLYPAGRCFFSVFKPSVHIAFADVEQITFQRVSSGGGSGGKMFDVVIELKKGGSTTYGQIQREDYEPLATFARSRGIRVKAEKVSDYANYADAGADVSDDGDDEDDQVPTGRALLGDIGGEDEDSSEDEDFDPDAKPAGSDAEEGSGSESDSEDEDGSDASGSEEERPAKPPKEKSSKPKESKPKEKKDKGEKSKGGEKGKEGKKPRKKKDPNEPKKPLAAFMIFSNDKREQVKKDNPEAGFGEIGRLLGNLWKEMTIEDKKPYNDRAGEAKARYLKEKAAYDAKQRASASASASAGSSSKEGGSGGGGGGGPGKKSALSAEVVDSGSSDDEDM